MQSIPLSTLRRLPVYLHYLNAVRDEKQNISASVIAAHYGLNDVQVRKDLAAASGSGKPRTGYDVKELIAQIEDCLGVKNRTAAVLVGAGNLGKALLSYDGFSDYGIDLFAAFDTDPALRGTLVHGKPIYALDALERVCREGGARLGIIAVPASCAQETLDRLARCALEAIWNFAPIILRAPEGILVENENLASSLAVLTRHLRPSEAEHPL